MSNTFTTLLLRNYTMFLLMLRKNVVHLDFSPVPSPYTTPPTTVQSLYCVLSLLFLSYEPLNLYWDFPKIHSLTVRVSGDMRFRSNRTPLTVTSDSPVKPTVVSLSPSCKISLQSFPFLFVCCYFL